MIHRFQKLLLGPLLPLSRSLPSLLFHRTVPGSGMRVSGSDWPVSWVFVLRVGAFPRLAPLWDNSLPRGQWPVMRLRSHHRSLQHNWTLALTRSLQHDRALAPIHSLQHDRTLGQVRSFLVVSQSISDRPGNIENSQRHC